MKITQLVVFGLIVWSLAAGSRAAPLEMSDVVSAYRGCSMNVNGDGSVTVAVTLDFTPAEKHSGGGIFLSRALMLTTYDKRGTPQITLPSLSVLGNFKDADPKTGPGYLLIRGMGGAWDEQKAFSTVAEITIPGQALADWPAVTIRAANYVAGTDGDVADSSGGAYITATSRGNCTILKDPSSPPPFDINITVDAPDWELGEIAPGAQTVPLTAARDRLCLTYTESGAAAKPFIINASNQNGVADGRYQLRNLQESAQVIPYDLILENGSRQVLLPNSSGASIPLDTGGKTCFSPLFRTFAPKNLREGDYSDVLTFTVVTPG